MNARWVTSVGRRWLIAEPRTHALGLLLSDIYIAMLVARETERPLCWLRNAALRKCPLLDLSATGVDHGSAIGRFVARSRARWQGLDPDAQQIHVGLDIRRLAAFAPLELSFPDALRRHAQALARRAGVPDDRPLVTMHVREGASKLAAGYEERDRDSVRSANPASFTLACDQMHRRGFTVVRIGDPTMSPIAHPGVVDLAHSPARSLLLDAWCVSRSHLFIASDSGPYHFSWLFNVPCLQVNITNTLGVYPLREKDRYLLKRLREVSTDRQLTLRETLSVDALTMTRRRVLKQRTWGYVDNTPEEILAGVREILDDIDHTPPETAAQVAFRELIVAARSADGARTKVLEKTGLPEVFLGAGRVVHAFAAELAHSPSLS